MLSVSDIKISPATPFHHKSRRFYPPNHKIGFLQFHFVEPTNLSMAKSLPSSVSPLICGKSEKIEKRKQIFDPHGMDSKLVQEMAHDALVWSSLHGLVVGDRSSQTSGRVPGTGLVHAPISLLPMPFPEGQWKQACEVAPIFNELIDRVSLDGKFLQESLARTKNVDAFTSRLLDIHAEMLDSNKKEEIRLGLHRSDYMLDEQTNLLLQIELNTISSSFPGLSCLVTELHRHVIERKKRKSFGELGPSTVNRSLLHQFKQHLSLDPGGIPQNNTVGQFAEALSKTWIEYNNPNAVVMVVVQTEERNMYDQHWLCTVLKERFRVRSIRKTLAEIDAQGKLLTDGTLIVDDESVAVVYFRAGYAPTDYPSESEWKARLLMEQSSAVKCPSISYHLAGTKKIQQELAKPHILERFLENKDDISKVKKCFAGLWSLEDPNIIKDAIQRPGSYVLKPQREGGGNNIYGDDLKLAVERMEKEENGERAAYILMQRIFPPISPAILMREGVYFKDKVVSELGLYAAYLRNKNHVIMNEHSGYLMRTKISSSNEGGVAAGFAVLDSIYLV